MKRIVCFILTAALALGLLACGNTAGTVTETKPVVQKDDGVLRVLLFGHSLGNDAMWMLPEAFTNEAPDTKVVLGFLYYSGCPLSAHVMFSLEPSPVYGYAEFDSEKDTYWRVAKSNGEFRPLAHGGTLDGSKPDSGISQTSLFALQQHDWDVVVTQGYPWEVTKMPTYDDNLVGNFTALKQYILDNDIDKETTPKFGWNMVWTFPDDNDLIRPSDRQIMTDNFSSVEEYYTKSAEIVRDELMGAFNFDYVMPSSTAYINALSGYKTTKEMYRDYVHASEFGRAMIAYLWYCCLTGADIADCKLEPINYNYRKDDLAYKNQEDMVLTDEEKQTIIEVVGNAISKPYEITPKA